MIPFLADAGIICPAGMELLLPNSRDETEILYMSPQTVSSEIKNVKICMKQVFPTDQVPSSSSLFHGTFCSHVQYYKTAVYITAAASTTLMITTGIKIHLQGYGEMLRLVQTSKTKHYNKCL